MIGHFLRKGFVMSCCGNPNSEPTKNETSSRGVISPNQQTTINRHLRFSDRASMISHTVWSGVKVTHRSIALSIGDNLLIAKFDKKSIQWEVDGHRTDPIENGIDVLNQSSKLELIGQYLADTKLDARVADLVAAMPYPDLTAFSSILGMWFSETLDASVDHTTQEMNNANKVVRAFSGQFGTPENCRAESGFCSPEFSSCVDCTQSIDIDEVFDPPGGGGGGGGSDDSFCQQMFNSSLRICQLSYQYCVRQQRRRPRGHQDSTESAPHRTSIVARMTPTTRLAMAAEFSCVRNFDACVLDLLDRLAFCQRHNGWPTGTPWF